MKQLMQQKIVYDATSFINDERSVAERVFLINECLEKFIKCVEYYSVINKD
jgi:hypothetical protein